MKIYKIISLLLFVLCTFSCVTKNDGNVKQKQIQNELTKIDSLIRDPDFTFSIARTLDSSYYTGIGQTPPDFLTAAEDTATINKSVKETKIATNLAGFYALECGIGALSEQTNQKPTSWLKKIIDNTADSNAILLLNRFANATWKASQPFRDLKRITRYNFTGAGFLSPEEIKKDYDQIKSAAIKLSGSMHDVENSSVKEQMQKLQSLLHDQQYAFEMAKFLDTCYYTNLGQPLQAFLSAADDTATTPKSLKEQKIAAAISGFYALECGINYLVTTGHMPPSDILRSIVDNTISDENKNLFLRFANATWKAGQPFIGLNRITRDNFIPFYFLTKDYMEKDYVQIKAAAKKLLSVL